MGPILEIRNLEKRFKGFYLNKVSLSLERGYIMGFIGPNGAGKSTTIKLIMNLLKRDGGEISLFGMDLLSHEREIKNKIGFVYEDNFYYEELTILEMKHIIAPLYTSWDNGLFTRYLKDFGLPGKKKMKELSKGMKIKFALAVALSHHAELLILDEPTSGLDPLVRHELMDILSSVIQDEGNAVFFSTHITSDLEKTADFITLIHDGNLLLSAPKDDILEQYGLARGAKESLNPETRQLFINIKENQFGFQGLVMDKEKTRRLLKDTFIIEKPSLEDIILHFTARN